jgi:hypothetical protein
VIRQRGKTFEVRVYSGLDPLTGKKRFLYGRAATQREAEKLEARLTIQAADGRHGYGRAGWHRDVVTSPCRFGSARRPRPAQWRADRVEVAEDFGEGSEGAALGVGEAVLLAEGADDRLRVAQVRSGHAGEQVVLDLVVEPAECKLEEPVPAHVA